MGERGMWASCSAQTGRTRCNEALKNKYGDLNNDIFNDGWIYHRDDGFVIKVIYKYITVYG